MKGEKNVSGRPPSFALILVFFSVLTASFLLVGLEAASGSGSVRGRFTYRGEGVAEGTVFFSPAYPPEEDKRVFEAETDREGYFAAVVPEGRYYVFGRGRGGDGKEVYAFSGQNPIDVGEEERFVGIKGVPVTAPSVSAGEEGTAVLKGMVSFKGKPVKGAHVYLYTDSTTFYKGLGFAVSPPTDESGEFFMDGLLETEYVVVARRRSSGEKTGPLEEGDLYCFFPGNPLSLFEGKETRVLIECVKKEKDVTYAEITSGTPLEVSGFVVDRMGNPVPGVYAFVYETRVFGHKRPYAHSGKTREDGKFKIHIDRPGTYYLGARENFGYTPRPGELFGFYGGTPDHSIVLEEGKVVKDLVIVVSPVLEGGSGEKEPTLRERVFDRGMPVKALMKDAVLSGTVEVDGILVVPRGVSVTIEPGTVVKFNKRDVDGDGIGDGEFYVEGKVYVKGTSEDPVLFTSAERSPAPKDWKYFFINMAEDARIEHLISEYAFSGLQIHFSEANVKDSLFRNNIDGLRFSTVRGVFEGNTMTGNVYGVRYEERATEAVLRRNRITGNKVGIFAVTECRGGLSIVENDVYGNETYDFKLGNRQKNDIPAGNNWWGNTDMGIIRENIFDGEDEPGLGTVIIEPIAEKSFCGRNGKVGTN